MNSDFRVATDWPDHPKTLHLIDLAGDVAALALIRLWAYTAQHRPDGALVGLNDASVEARAGWLGAPGAFVAAILSVPPGGRFKVGYAARDRAGHLTLHDWKEHNAYAASDPVRTRAAKIGAAARWSKNQELNADRMRVASNPHDAPSPAPAPAPSPAPAPHAGEKHLLTAPTSRGDPVRGDLEPGAPERRKAALREWLELFDLFWPHYPRKIAKRDALKAWREIAPHEPAEVDRKARGVGIVLSERKRSDWRDRPKDRIPYPASFLRAEEFPLLESEGDSHVHP